jgi:hypothetical protein
MSTSALVNAIRRQLKTKTVGNVHDHGQDLVMQIPQLWGVTSGKGITGWL